MKRDRYIAERKKRGLSGKQIRNRAGMAAAVLFAAVMAGGCATPAQFPDTIKVQDVNDSEGITVTGKEEVKVVPDMTEIRYGVYSQAQTASQCQEDNAKQLDQTIETLKGLGVEETSIQTSAYGLSPIYDWNSGDRTITGYEMNTEITVSDIPIDQAGEILSQSVTAGVNQIESVTYFSSQYDESYQEALKGAVAMARSKAEAMAEASGKKLSSVVDIQEYGYNPQARYSSYNAPAAKMAVEETAAASDMAVMPGEVSVEAQVTVTYGLE